jgi:hypothetical protein
VGVSLVNWRRFVLTLTWPTRVPDATHPQFHRASQVFEVQHFSSCQCKNLRVLTRTTIYVRLPALGESYCEDEARTVFEKMLTQVHIVGEGYVTNKIIWLCCLSSVLILHLYQVGRWPAQFAWLDLSNIFDYIESYHLLITLILEKSCPAHLFLNRPILASYLFFTKLFHANTKLFLLQNRPVVLGSQYSC